MAVKLVITDLDGTLLSPERTISDKAVETIAAWKNQGGMFSFITGRPAFGVREFAARVGVNAPMVCCNGAELVEYAENGGRTLIKKGMKLSGLRTLMELADQAGMTVLYYTEGEEYAMGLTDWVAVRRARGRSYPVQEHGEYFWQQTEAEKVNIMSDGNAGEFQKLKQLMQELNMQYNVIIYENFGCEIVRKDCNKAVGLRELAEYLHLDMKEIMVLGDNANDLEMLQAAGTGVAVGNATPDAKASADYVCSACNTDGVIEALQKFCLNTEKGR